MRKPYIGVTGVVTSGEALQMDYLAGSIIGSPGTHRLMAGVLVSGKTMAGERVPSRRYPDVSEIRGITDILARKSFATIHFNTRVPEPLDAQVLRVLDLAPAASGVQLNVIRPDVAAVTRLKAAAPDLEIILQMNGSSLRHMAVELDARECQNGGEKRYMAGTTRIAMEDLGVVVGHYMEEYAGVVDHALLDLSGGRGTSMNAGVVGRTLLECIERAQNLGITLGVAGGLGPNSGPVLGPIVECLPKHLRTAWSIDAESRVRQPSVNPIPNEDAQDDLDMHAVAGYVRMAVGLFAEAQEVAREEAEGRPGTGPRMNAAPQAICRR